MRYQKYIGGEGRSFDPNSTRDDGQKERVRGDFMYERPDYCQNCRLVNSSFEGVPFAIDCRTLEEEATETKLLINLD